MRARQLRRSAAGAFAVLAVAAMITGPVPAGADPSLRPSACDSSYWPCLPPPPPQLSCAQIGHKVWLLFFRRGADGTIYKSDPHDLDRDSTGTACEGYPDPPEGLPSDNPLPGSDEPVWFIPSPTPPVPRRCLVYSAPLPSTGSPTTSPSRFVPLPSPQRLFDTRAQGDDGYVCPGRTIVKQVTGRAGVPASGVTAVALNVTGVLPGGEGYVTVYPGGAPRPDASSLNFTGRDQMRANLVIVPVGVDGSVSFYSQSGIHLIVDVAGYFEPSTASTAGRLAPVAPTRILDTRIGLGAPGTKPAANQTIDLQVAGRGGVPASGASAVVLNLTGADATAGGFVTAWPSGAARPDASNLNLVGPHDTAPNLAIVPLGAGGHIQLFTEAGVHLIADVFGWFGDGSQPLSASGLFVPIGPSRVFDTRPDSFVGAGVSIIRAHTGVAGVPGSGVAAIALNVTATQAGGAGYITAWPADRPLPNVSSLNLSGTGDTRPNAAILPVPTNGQVAFYAERGAHLIADTSGYFTS